MLQFVLLHPVALLCVWIPCVGKSKKSGKNQKHIPHEQVHQQTLEQIDEQIVDVLKVIPQASRRTWIFPLLRGRQRSWSGAHHPARTSAPTGLRANRRHLVPLFNEIHVSVVKYTPQRCLNEVYGYGGVPFVCGRYQGFGTTSSTLRSVSGSSKKTTRTGTVIGVLALDQGENRGPQTNARICSKPWSLFSMVVFRKKCPRF